MYKTINMVGTQQKINSIDLGIDYVVQAPVEQQIGDILTNTPTRIELPTGGDLVSAYAGFCPCVCVPVRVVKKGDCSGTYQVFAGVGLQQNPS